MRKTLVSIALLSLLVIPVAGQAQPGSKAKDQKKAAAVAKAKSPKKVATVTYVLKGTVQTAGEEAIVVEVAKSNRHGKFLREQDVLVSSSNVKVADLNGDGVQTLADVQVGDRVVVKVRLPKRLSSLENVVEAGQALKARQVVNQTNPEVEDEDEDEVAPETPPTA